MVLGALTLASWKLRSEPAPELVLCSSKGLGLPAPLQTPCPPSLASRGPLPLPGAVSSLERASLHLAPTTLRLQGIVPNVDGWEMTLETNQSSKQNKTRQEHKAVPPTLSSQLPAQEKGGQRFVFQETNSLATDTSSRRRVLRRLRRVSQPFLCHEGGTILTPKRQ